MVRGMFTTPPQEGTAEGQEPAPFILPTRAHGPDDGGDGGTGDEGGDDGTGGTGTDDPGTGNNGNGDDDQGSQELTLEAATAALEAARKEAAAYRRRLREREAAEEEERRKGLPELERLQADLQSANERATKAEQTLRERELGDEVATAAKTLGFRNPAKALRYIDRDGLVDDDGAVDTAEVTKRLRAALKEEPYLGGATAGGADAGAGRNRTTPAAGVNDQIRAMARRGRVAS